MKKVVLAVVCFITLCTSILFISCTTNKSNNNNGTSSSKSNTSSNSNKIFTLDELKKYNGQNGTAAYVAVNGIVYDVTNARRWRNGVHEDGIVAGVDLTNSMADSPHGNSVLKDLPIIGKLK